MKIPMFLYKISSLGAKFAITRWVVDLVGIIVMAQIIDKLVSSEEKDEIYKIHAV